MSGRRTYHLFPGGRSGFTSRSFEYHGTYYVVVATSVRQAHALAHRRVWVTGAEGVGIVGVYARDGGGWTLWDGCTGHVGFDLKHGVGPRAIEAAVTEHQRAHART